jgi:hypothetical protein
MSTTIALGSANASYTNGYPISLTCWGPRGGFAGHADLSSEAARVLAQQLLDCADDADSDQPTNWWVVNMSANTDNRVYQRGVKATCHADALARAERMRDRIDPDSTILSVEGGTP